VGRSYELDLARSYFGHGLTCCDQWDSRPGRPHVVTRGLAGPCRPPADLSNLTLLVGWHESHPVKKLCYISPRLSSRTSRELNHRADLANSSSLWNWLYFCKMEMVMLLTISWLAWAVFFVNFCSLLLELYCGFFISLQMPPIYFMLFIFCPLFTQKSFSVSYLRWLIGCSW